MSDGVLYLHIIGILYLDSIDIIQLNHNNAA